MKEQPIDRGILDIGLNHCPQVINYLTAIYGENGVPREGKLAEAWRHDCEERLLEFSPHFFKAFAYEESVFAVVKARLFRKRKAIELINELHKLLEIRSKIPLGKFTRDGVQYTSTILKHSLMSLGERLQLLVRENKEVIDYKKYASDTFGEKPDLTREVASS